jgi:hypothetical protein
MAGNVDGRREAPPKAEKEWLHEKDSHFRDRSKPTSVEHIAVR